MSDRRTYNRLYKRRWRKKNPEKEYIYQVRYGVKRKKRYWDRKFDGLCTKCGQLSISDAYCGDCLMNKGLYV